MKILKYADFPVEEYLSRFDKARKLMQGENIDALFLTQRENLRYFAGFRDGAWGVKHFYYCCLLPADEDIKPMLYLGETDDFLAQESWIEEEVYWKWPRAYYMGRGEGSGFVATLVETLKKKGLDRGKIATEIGTECRLGFSQREFDELRKTLPKVEFVDGDEIIFGCRRIKSSLEIECIRRACEISIEALKRGFQSIQEGMSEEELASIIRVEMCRRGATDLNFMAIYAGFDRAMWADSMPTGYRFKKGDTIQFDGGSSCKGYCCDFKRMAIVGKPSKKVLEQFEVAKEAITAGIKSMVIGNRCHNVCEICFQKIREGGFPKMAKWSEDEGFGAVGHSIGLDIHEQPGLSLGNNTKLEEGMVFSIEPCVFEDDIVPWKDAKQRYGLEDEVLVTKDGPEVLTQWDILSHDLWVAG